jgi:hypothetical protein
MDPPEPWVETDAPTSDRLIDPSQNGVSDRLIESSQNNLSDMASINSSSENTCVICLEKNDPKKHCEKCCEFLICDNCIEV